MVNGTSLSIAVVAITYEDPPKTQLSLKQRSGTKSMLLSSSGASGGEWRRLGIWRWRTAGNHDVRGLHFASSSWGTLACGSASSLKFTNLLGDALAAALRGMQNLSTGPAAQGRVLSTVSIFVNDQPVGIRSPAPTSIDPVKLFEAMPCVLTSTFKRLNV
jgi:hypothetical protein